MAKTITLEQAQTTLAAALAAVEAEKAVLDAAKAEANGNLMLLMTKLMPKIIEIIGQRTVCVKYRRNPFATDNLLKKL